MKTRAILACMLAAVLGIGCLGVCDPQGAWAAEGAESQGAHAAAASESQSARAALAADAQGVQSAQGDLAAGEVQVAAASANKPAKPSKAQLKRFKKASADFSLDLFARCVAAKGKGANVTVAPLSVMNALAVTANGASGKTAKQLRKVLGDGASMSTINQCFAWYNGSLSNTKKARLRVANAIWYHNDGTLKMKKAFLKKAKKYYGAAVEAADFSSPQTVDQINAWVADNTNDMIKRIIAQLDRSDRIAIVNALSFDAKWAQPYEKNQVRKATFTTARGQKRKVQMMYGTEHTYLEGNGAVGFMKPYAKGYSYVALLPKKGTSLKAFVSKLDGDAFRKLIAGAREVTVHTALPKYTLSYSNEDMADQLQAMGITDAFGGNADFSKMATDDEGNLQIGAVVHKTKIILDEQGTKAAAVTAVVMKNGSLLDPDAKTVTLNRPFVYAIVDNATKLPVFIGTVNTIGK